MIKQAYNKGVANALRYFKLSNLQQGAAGYNPTLTGQAATAAPNTNMAPPAAASPAIAAGAPKSKVLG